MLPASGSPRSTMIPESTPSSRMATRTSNGSTLARISLRISLSLLQTLRPPNQTHLPGGSRSGVKSNADVEVAHADVQQEERRPAHRHQGAPSVADERQGNPGDRHDPDGHSDVHKHVERDHGHDPHGCQRAEAIARLPRDPQAAGHPEEEAPQEHDRAD